MAKKEAKVSKKVVSKKGGAKKTAPKKKVARKTKATKKAAPATSITPAPVELKADAPATAPVEQAPTQQVQVSSWEQKLTSLIAQTVAIADTVKTLTKTLRVLKKEVNKELSEVRKVNKRLEKKQAKQKKRQPSGFAKPTKISNELCDFLSKPYGTEMARTEVTRELTQYIRDKGLQDQANKRRILCDKRLGDLLKVAGGEEVTYFNLQKFMKPHFPASQSSKARSA